MNEHRQGMGYLFDRGLARTPEKVAVYQDDVAVTYAALEERTNRVAAALLGLGVGRGDRVALLFDNHYRYVEAYFGAMRIGAVAVPINPRLGDESVAYILDHSDAVVFLCSPNESARGLRLAPRAPKLRALIGFTPHLEDAARTPSQLPVFDFEAWTAAASAAEPGIAIDVRDIAFAPYTSGSTGKPKGCLLTHEGQLWNIASMARFRAYSEDDRALTAAPLSHKNAMVSAIKPMLSIGGSVVILPRFEPEAYVRAIERYRVTYTTGVPAIYNLVFARPELMRRYDVSSVRFSCVGSSSVSPEILKLVAQHFNGAPVTESYGSTEGGPVTLIQPRDHTVGMLPIEGTAIRVLLPDGTDCRDEEIGELVVRNPGILREYYKNPEATAERIVDGWYHTRDFVRRTPEGRYFIIGRTDDLIITAAENVYPKEVEDLLRSHPAVADAAVVPREHAIKGEVPVAFVVLRPGAIASEDELKRFALDRGPAFAHPRNVWFVPEIPLSGPGKIDRHELRRRANAEGALTGAAS